MSLFSPNLRNGYVADLLRNYGDGGRPMQLPKVNPDLYQRGLEFREKEKKHYSRLQERLHDTERRLFEARQQNATFAKFIQSIEFLDDEVTDASAGSNSNSNSVSHSGVNVLPAARNSDQDDSNNGPAEAIISGGSTADESANASCSGPRRNNAQPKQEDAESTSVHVGGSDSGRTPKDATNDAKPDVGGSTNEHNTAE